MHDHQKITYIFIFHKCLIPKQTNTIKKILWFWHFICILDCVKWSVQMIKTDRNEWKIWKMSCIVCYSEIWYMMIKIKTIEKLDYENMYDEFWGVLHIVNIVLKWFWSDFYRKFWYANEFYVYQVLIEKWWKSTFSEMFKTNQDQIFLNISTDYKRVLDMFLNSLMCQILWKMFKFWCSWWSLT